MQLPKMHRFATDAKGSAALRQIMALITKNLDVIKYEED
jgi:hypothetical protein